MPGTNMGSREEHKQELVHYGGEGKDCGNQFLQALRRGKKGKVAVKENPGEEKGKGERSGGRLPRPIRNILI